MLHQSVKATSLASIYQLSTDQGQDTQNHVLKGCQCMIGVLIVWLMQLEIITCC